MASRARAGAAVGDRHRGPGHPVEPGDGRGFDLVAEAIDFVVVGNPAATRFGHHGQQLGPGGHGGGGVRMSRDAPQQPRRCQHVAGKEGRGPFGKASGGAGQSRGSPLGLSRLALGGEAEQRQPVPAARSGRAHPGGDLIPLPAALVRRPPSRPPPPRPRAWWRRRRRGRRWRGSVGPGPSAAGHRSRRRSGAAPPARPRRGRPPTPPDGPGSARPPPNPRPWRRPRPLPRSGRRAPGGARPGGAPGGPPSGRRPRPGGLRGRTTARCGSGSCRRRRGR